MPLHLLVFAILLAASPNWISLVCSYTFDIVTTPQQCKNLSIVIEGGDAKQPYQLLVIPYIKVESDFHGSETSIVVNKIFVGNSVSFQLVLPERQRFVIAVRNFSLFAKTSF